MRRRTQQLRIGTHPIADHSWSQSSTGIDTKVGPRGACIAT